MKTTRRRANWHIMDPVKSQINLGMFLSVLCSACSLTTLILIALLLKNVIEEQGIYAWWYVLGILITTVAAYILRLEAFNQSHYAAYKLEAIIRKRISARLAQMPLGFLVSTGSGALSKIMKDDVSDLHSFVADSTPLYGRAYGAPIMTLLALLYFDWRLALVSLLVFVGGMAILNWAMSRSRTLMQEFNASRERVNSAVVEFVQAMPVVRTFDAGRSSFGIYQESLKRYDRVLRNWIKESGPAARLSMLILNPLPTLLALIWAGAYFWFQNTLSFSTWVAILLMGTGLVESLAPYMTMYHLRKKSEVSIARIDEIDHAEVLPITTNPQQPKDDSIEFSAVSFIYPQRQEKAIDSISFQVPPGSFTALVGASGSGKTTIARLLPRFWDVTSGVIRIGGVDIRDMDTETLMNQVAFVFQDQFLFSDTIANNIRLGMPQATDEEVVQAAMAAQAHDFIMALPQGYETHTGERGMFMSGGQRQRITIARAILQNRPILILDEATAFADAENEALLMQALAKLMVGKTVVMVAHRLSTIRDADNILVLDAGRLVEQGRHDELLAHHGVYARLWRYYEAAQDWRVGHNTETNKAGIQEGQA